MILHLQGFVSRPRRLEIFDIRWTAAMSFLFQFSQIFPQIKLITDRQFYFIQP